MKVDAPEHSDTFASPGDHSPGGPFVARLTSDGRGAIAVLRVWGNHAVAITDAVFRPKRGVRLAESPTGALRLGRIGPGQGDEVVAVVLDRTWPVVEVQCHGGVAAVDLVFTTLVSAGATPADAGPSLAEHPGDDPLAAQAQADFARASTVLTAEILLDQMQGALRDALVQLGRSIDEQPGRALDEVDLLVARGQLGLRLSDGWKVSIAGRPNVGKSRLFNALVGFARTIVDPVAGTTRDVISFRVSFGGWPVELADTAGLRETGDPVERIGVERALREHETADLVVLVLDRSRPLEPVDHELVTNNPGAVVVANKSDLPAAWRNTEASDPPTPMVTVSAATNAGIDELIGAIVARLVPQPPAPGQAVPFRVDHLESLGLIRRSLEASDRARAARQLEALIERRIETT
jgi:tRNA modification GTPase